MYRREGELPLGLDPTRPQNRGVLRAPGEGIEQRRLAHPYLASDYERPSATAANTCDQVSDHRHLRLPPQERRGRAPIHRQSRLAVAGRHTGRSATGRSTDAKALDRA
jgi:hypothetical protein